MSYFRLINLGNIPYLQFQKSNRLKHLLSILHAKNTHQSTAHFLYNRFVVLLRKTLISYPCSPNSTQDGLSGDHVVGGILSRLRQRQDNRVSESLQPSSGSSSSLEHLLECLAIKTYTNTLLFVYPASRPNSPNQEIYWQSWSVNMILTCRVQIEAGFRRRNLNWAQ